MKVQRKVYIALEVEFDSSLGEDYKTAYEAVDDAITLGLDKMDSWLCGLDEVERVSFVEVELK